MKTDYNEDIQKVNSAFVDKDVWYLKKGKRRVYMLSKGNKHSKVLIPFPAGHISKAGLQGEVASVRTENLIKAKEML